MKKIECIIPHRNFTKVEQALRNLGIRGMTVTDVKGFGNEQTRPEPFLYLPKIKLELYCTEEESADVIETILTHCRTGQLGDGKIAVIDLEEVVRIRTGERGEVAV